jgi:cell division protein FtsL
MTPSALTPAARQADRKRASGHRPSVTRPTTPRSPRRVSGPAGGISRSSRRTTTPPPAAAAPTAAAEAGQAPARSQATRTAPTRTATTRTRRARAPRPARPRRVSGPLVPGRSLRIPRRAARSAPAGPPRPLGVRVGEFVRALPDHALLDRIIRGRVWIPLLGVLLVGIVAMQVTVLKLNAGIGRSLQQTTALQGENELLRANVARLSDSERIEALAARLGMVMPPPQEDRFITPTGATVARAVGAITAPNATNFSSNLAAEQASIAAQVAASSASSSTPATSGTTPSTAASGATALAASTTGTGG